MSDDVSLVKTVILRAPKERVWAFLCEPDLLARWFHEAQAPLRAGHPFALIRENPVSDDPRLVWGDVLLAEPPDHLVHTFHYHGQHEDIQSRVEWTLETLSDATKLTLTHRCTNASPDALCNEIKALDGGWDSHLVRLRTIFA